MEPQIILTSILILVLVIVSTTKSALDELSDVALRRLALEKGKKSSAAFLRYARDHYPLFSFTLTFGIHLSIAFIAILITSLAFRIHATYFLPISFLGMAITLILFRQAIPLLLTQNDPARTLLRFYWPLRVIYLGLAVIAHPLYRILRGFQREEEKKPRPDDEVTESNEEELQVLLDVGEEEGIIEQDEGEMIQSIVRFGNRTVAEVMTPRTRIVAIESSATIEAVRDLMIESKYSRLPVYRDDPDNIEGVIYVRDLLHQWAVGQSDRTALDLARPVFFIPETKRTDELLREMQKARTPMAIVIDEYGGLAGLATMEDLLEEIVGEIEDEDEPLPQETEIEISQETPGCYAVRGDVEIGKIERLFDTELADDDFTTVAGLVINQLGHLPTAGEKISFNGLRFEVTKVDERRVSRLKISRPTSDELSEEMSITAAALEESK
jgi:CBS domain containing-hemolysin-like protein